MRHSSGWVFLSDTLLLWLFYKFGIIHIMKKYNYAFLRRWLQEGIGGRDWRGTSNNGYKVDRVWAVVMIATVVLLVIFHLFGIKLYVSKSPEQTATSSNNIYYSKNTAIKISTSTYVVQEPAYLVGSGTEIYEITGYYHKYDVQYYPPDYDPHYDKDFPKTFTCNGFIVTGGSQQFITAYNRLAGQINGKTIISLDNINPNRDPEFPREAIYISTIDKQITIQLDVFPLPERGVIPCDSYGIHFVK